MINETILQEVRIQQIGSIPKAMGWSVNARHHTLGGSRGAEDDCRGRGKSFKNPETTGFWRN
jgi:hypothetical protein